jgi:hypothetical protein
MERNARDHMASFVLFTGDVPRPESDSEELSNVKNAISNEYGTSVSWFDLEKLAYAKYSYEAISKSHDSFRITTNEGVDADDGEDGMRPRVFDVTENMYVAKEESERALNPRIFQGFKYGDLPTTYVIGDGVTYA